MYIGLIIIKSLSDIIIYITFLNLFTNCFTIIYLLSMFIIYILLIIKTA